MKDRIHISVRSLVESALRSGDLHSGQFVTNGPDHAIRLHRLVQTSRPGEYVQEAPVFFQVETPSLILEISGRIDGVWRSPGLVVIEEIKTTAANLDSIEAENPVHRGQLKVYAFMYSTRHDLEKIETQLTYVHSPSGQVKEFRCSYTRDDLQAFFDELVQSCLFWAERAVFRHQLRDDSIRKLGFPYPVPRPGQERMIAEVFQAIEDQERLLVQAPTGIGKTMAALFPAVKSMAEGLTDKIFYLTAKTTGRTAAKKALDELRRNGLRIKSVTLTAKEKACLDTVASCRAEDCGFARGYYDRLSCALEELWPEDSLTRDTIEQTSLCHQVCPFELARELMTEADVIICDYNHVLDPKTYLKRFFLETKGRFTFLIDEAHNLAERAREMFSAEINAASFSALTRRLKQDLPEVYSSLKKINKWLVEAKKKTQAAGGFLAEREGPDSLYPLLEEFLQSAVRWMAVDDLASFRQDFLDLYFRVIDFSKIAAEYDDRFATIYERKGRDLRLKLFCLDPSTLLDRALKRGSCAVLFSATLNPMEYYREILGCPDGHSLKLPNPFPISNLCLLICDGISARYQHRRLTSVEVARSISALVSQKKGNYLVFLPSYEYLRLIHESFIREYPDLELMPQHPSMSESEKTKFLERFNQKNTRTLVGFAVMGGIFGEGLDLAGDRLSGAVIVSLCLPGLGAERELIRLHFNDRNSSGFEYAYLYPGLNRVLQAAGRVIRSETDRGAVLLIDERFGRDEYQARFPEEWQPVAVQGAEEIEDILSGFWEEI